MVSLEFFTFRNDVLERYDLEPTDEFCDALRDPRVVSAVRRYRVHELAFDADIDTAPQQPDDSKPVVNHDDFAC